MTWHDNALVLNETLKQNELPTPCRSISITAFNPPLAGGGGEYRSPPLANFLNNFKTRQDIGAKVTVPNSASIWDPQTKFQQNPSRSF